MMKFLAITLVLFSNLVSAQTTNEVSNLNNYKYLYLSAGSLAAQFMQASLYEDAKTKLTDCGFKVVRKKEKQQIADTCAIVYCFIEDYAELGTVRGNTNTCVRLNFKDCNGQQVFVSKMGYSGNWLKGTKMGYELATSEALQSFDDFHYAYRQK